MDAESWAALLAGGPAPATGPGAALAPLAAARAAGRGLVVGQLGLSLDGRIATETGDSHYINGAEARAHLHRLRALTDAVLVGAGTARADDPQLTVRHCTGPAPARVVIDPRGTVGADARVWAADGCRRLVFGGAADLPAGVERLALPAGGLTPAAILSALAARGLTRVLVEGGADTLARFLDAGALDALHLLYGPVIIGSGRAGLTLPPIARLSDALRPQTTAHVFADGDVLIACRLQRSGGTA